MRRILNQCANAAVKAKGTIFEIVYRRLVSRLGHNQTIGAIALLATFWAPARRTRILRMRELRLLLRNYEKLANSAAREDQG
jgi:hypothetical protein